MGAGFVCLIKSAATKYAVSKAPRTSKNDDTFSRRPSSVDSASQTVETGTRCAPVDVNFNLKSSINPTDLVILGAYGIPYQVRVPAMSIKCCAF